jgi:RNA polymerase sigma-32 factor
MRVSRFERSQEKAAGNLICAEVFSGDAVSPAPELVADDAEARLFEEGELGTEFTAVGPHALVRSEPLARFLAEARRYPRLSDAEERRLTLLARTGDAAAAQRLVLHNLRLVVVIALRYQRAWTQLIDLIQEGTIGLIEAMRRWDASLGARFGTYAAYWIRAYILRFIMTNARLVSIANTRAGRKLFFRLERERRQLLSEGFDPTPKLLSARLDIPEEEVRALAGHIEAPEISIDAAVDNGAPTADGLSKPEPSPEEIAAENEFRRVLARLIDDFQQTLADDRERAVWQEHLATEDPLPLSTLGERYGVSKQRMGQIANGLKKRFRAEVLAKFGADARINWLRLKT